MKILDRLKLELSNKKYFTDEEYTIFLEENELSPNDNYDKNTMQRGLLYTVLDVLEALSNDTDLMRKLDNKDLMSTNEAYKYLQLQIENIKKRISALPSENDAEGYSSFSLMFTRNR
ncbi:hypothetical protein GCM10008905_16470 [Clostridium malenominatum]|uniref:Uncharacterized protein n=1 Tax=Clostridium malenominatum TaxID=1539 RepID=A0ABN1IY98_9CLOT